jgi:hypothetical protein
MEGPINVHHQNANQDGHDGQYEDSGAAVDRRMEITAAECSWALTIQEAIQSDPELDNLSDFWYVQLAIVHKDDVEKALDVARNLQCFRQEYDIRDTIEDAKKTVWDFMNLFENFTISFGYSVEDENYLWAVDIAAIDNKLLQTDKAWRTNLAGVYYFRQALNPDFLSIGNGMSLIHECEGFDFHGKFGGLGHLTRLAKELIGEYPGLVYCCKWYNTGKQARSVGALLCNLAHGSLAKALLLQDIL